MPGSASELAVLLLSHTVRQHPEPPLSPAWACMPLSPAVYSSHGPTTVLAVCGAVPQQRDCLPVAQLTFRGMPHSAVRAVQSRGKAVGPNLRLGSALALTVQTASMLPDVLQLGTPLYCALQMQNLTPHLYQP